ncbi:MAG: hypothetical protein NZ602_14245 [Thermoguttaceae bacterium]|nr:hypothetical protein [Thermoguttaceae bacterium]MDW8039609.1 hypothetical protein [Thermoguttaceae bacterium]
MACGTVDRSPSRASTETAFSGVGRMEIVGSGHWQAEGGGMGDGGEI